MNAKERLLAAITGKEVDKVPWSPFLAYWWESQPKKRINAGQISFMQEIGADPLLRGFHQLHKIKYGKCSVYEKVNKSKKIERYETPVGELVAEYTYVKEANSWFLTKHLVESKEDFKILTYLVQDMIIEADLDKFTDDYNKLGDKGLYLPVIGAFAKTSFQALLEHFVGTEQLTYSLLDYPETVKECLREMRIKSKKTVEIAIESKAEGFIFWEDSSTTNLSPAMFETYTAPEIDMWGKMIHDSDKLLIHHACGHIKDLLPLMAKTNIDAIESVTPPPTGNVEIWDAKKNLPDHISLVGGIDPVFLLKSSISQLKEYVYNLLDKMRRDNFIIANSDSCPPGVEIEKFIEIAKIVKDYS